jgi:hypothetical protein
MLVQAAYSYLAGLRKLLMLTSSMKTRVLTSLLHIMEAEIKV